MSYQNNNEIRSNPRSNCYVCDTLGEPLYKNLQDRLFDASGSWNLKKCLNKICGLVWLDPMPLREDISKAYLNYFTHENTTETPYSFSQHVYLLAKKGYLYWRYGYHSETVSTWKKLMGILVYIYPGFKAHCDSAFMYIPAQPKRRLLDVGCGDGKLLKRFAEIGWQVEGVDLDPSAVKNARSKGVRAHFGTLEDQRYPGSYFDIVTMSHFIEHSYDPLGELRESYRVLRPDGYLVLTTPNICSWGHRLFKEAYYPLDPPRHLHIFSSQSLRILSERAGFKKLKIWTTNRQANNIFLDSLSIQRTGKYVLGSPRPLSLRIWTLGMQLLEEMILNVKPDIASEIAMIGYKT